jgi:endonuclease/exonuclease/phosphatase (EEP) superfamily protein YafD
VLVHSHFIKNPPIDLEEMNPTFFRWFCHTNLNGLRLLKKEKVGVDQIKLVLMKGGFCNIRGLNKNSRAKVVADLINMNKLDFLGLQETKKEIISLGFLKTLNKNFEWKYLPSRGTTRAILVGFRYSLFEIKNWFEFKYCVVPIVHNQKDNFVWRIVVVYGSPYEEFKLEFIKELHRAMGQWVGPTLVGGDFNHVRN